MSEVMTLERALSGLEGLADDIGGEYPYVASDIYAHVEAIRAQLVKAGEPIAWMRMQNDPLFSEPTVLLTIRPEDHPPGSLTALSAALAQHRPTSDASGFDRTRETPRRQQAVEKLLALGWTYHHVNGWTSPTVEQAGEVVAWRWRSPAEVEFGKGWNLTADAEFAAMLVEAEGHQVEPLSPPRPVGVPDGWKLVPTSVELDNALNEAGWVMVLAYGRDVTGRGFNMTKTYLRDAITKWIELSAAPSPTVHSRDVDGE
jgi:hypothetical protein